MKISIENLSTIYDEEIILDNLNIELKDVKVVGIIGESGCGKSTLLRQLSGIEIPKKGLITVNEMKINNKNLKEYQNKIGFVFQKHNLFPHLSIKDNILLILEKIKGMNKKDAEVRCNALLKEFRISEQADNIPNKVSGGQAQRASIVRALATNPELIFLDEPTAALDPLLTKEVLESIQQLKEDGVEFVFVTHEMEFLRKFADYYIFMDKGSIVEHGLINELELPKTEKLRNFVKR